MFHYQQNHQNHANCYNHYAQPTSAATTTFSIYGMESVNRQEPFEFERSGLRKVEEQFAEWEREKKEIEMDFGAVLSLAAAAGPIRLLYDASLQLFVGKL